MEETYSIYYRESLNSEPILIIAHLDYDDVQDLLLFLGRSVETSIEKNYQGIPVEIGLFFKED